MTIEQRRKNVGGKGRKKKGHAESKSVIRKTVRIRDKFKRSQK